MKSNRTQAPCWSSAAHDSRSLTQSKASVTAWLIRAAACSRGCCLASPPRWWPATSTRIQQRASSSTAVTYTRCALTCTLRLFSRPRIAHPGRFPITINVLALYCLTSIALFDRSFYVLCAPSTPQLPIVGGYCLRKRYREYRAIDEAPDCCGVPLDLLFGGVCLPCSLAQMQREIKIAHLSGSPVAGNGTARESTGGAVSHGYGIQGAAVVQTLER